MPPIDLNTLPLPDLYAELSRGGLVRRLLELARDEDLGPGGEPGDLTGMLALGRAGSLTAEVRARAEGVVAGVAVVPELLSVFAPGCSWRGERSDGEAFERGDTLGALTGPAEQIVRVERTLLNLLGRLCGVATRTRAFRGRISAFPRCALLDTRKTTPGLRVLEKYAVRCGGGVCHRLGLYDAVLIKDNHLAGLPPAQAAERVRTTSDAARLRFAETLRFVEVEVDMLEQLDAMLALPAGVVDHILLDNMPPPVLAEAVSRRRMAGCGSLLEASGGITLESISGVASTGIDRISVGSLTHGAETIDLGLDAV